MIVGIKDSQGSSVSRGQPQEELLLASPTQSRWYGIPPFLQSALPGVGCIGAVALYVSLSFLTFSLPVSLRLFRSTKGVSKSQPARQTVVNIMTHKPNICYIRIEIWPCRSKQSLFCVFPTRLPATCDLIAGFCGVQSVNTH
jgi:hypothetical protein